MTPHLSISRYLPTLTCIQYSYCRPYSDCRPFPKTYTMRFSCITVMHVMITCIRSNFLWAPGDYWQWHAIAFRCFAYPHCKSMHFTHCEHCIQYKFLIYPLYEFAIFLYILTSDIDLFTHLTECNIILKYTNNVFKHLGTFWLGSRFI